jgi:hypothetical protein
MKYLKHPATVIAALALFIASGGGAAAYASGLISGSQIKNHSIAEKKLSEKAIKALRGQRGPRGSVGPAGPTGPPGPAGPIGAGRVLLTQAQLLDPSTIRAFIETDSTSLPCLVTLAESNDAVPGQTVYCAPRDFSDHQGLLISVFYPQDAVPLPSDLVVVVTVYQEFAQQYGAPTLYPGI